MDTTTAKIIGDDPRYILDETVVALDTETTGLTWDAYAIGVSLAWRQAEEIKTCYLFLELAKVTGQLSLFGSMYPSIDVQPLLQRLFEKNRIVFHTASFDYRFLFKDLGLPPPERPIDIVQLAKCLDYQPSLSLISLYQKYIKWAIPADLLEAKKDRGNLHTRDIYSQSTYARWDAEATLRLFDKLFGEASLSLDDGLLTHDMRFTNLTMSLVKRGLPVDLHALVERRKQYRGRIGFIVMELANTHNLFDVGSDNQVSKYLYHVVGLNPIRQTAGGRGAVGVDDLKPFAKSHPAVPLIIEHRQLAKAISSWLDPLESLASMDGRAHSQLDPFGTRSFRMSSKDINLQAVPMKARGERAFDAFQGIFKSDIPGEQLWAIDLKQAEVRLAAILAPDGGLAEVFSAGTDPYKTMSKQLWGTEERRQDAKQATLSAIYEVGPTAFAFKYGVSEEYAKNVLDTFRGKFPGIKRASNQWSRYVEKHKYVQLYTGRLRWFGPDDEPWKGFNQVVQGGVAELMSDIMLEVERVLPNRLILQIHDSLVLYLPASEIERDPMIEQINDIARSILPEDVVKHVQPRVPLLCDAEIWE